MHSASEYDLSSIGLDFLWLEVTQKCNLRCVHCYAESTPFLPIVGAMEYQDWQNVLQQGFSLGCPAVQFIGGEPTIYPHLSSLIEEARKIGYTFIEVFTNGTTLNDSHMDVFIRNGVQVAFSVYAHKSETHEKITQTKGSFDRTIQGIRLAKANGLTVRAGIIVMDANVSEVEETKSLLRSIGVESVGSDRVRGIGRGHDLVPGALPFDELCGSCWKGKLAIDTDGNAFPCIFSKFCPLGNVRQGLAPVLQSVSLHNFRNKLKNQMVPSERSASAAHLSGACDPATCYPQTRPCSPDCAPSSDRCIPEMRGRIF